MTTLDPTVRGLVERWRVDETDPASRDFVDDLVARAENGDEAAITELHERFGGHLTFGTAGLRAELGVGTLRMNRVVVGHAAHGLARYLVEKNPGHTPSVVIGFDARHQSDIFAKDSAEIMAGYGIRVFLFEGSCPTPVLASAVRDLEVDAGVMVTASHNPPRDNGYKVYLGGTNGGSQIVPPADEEIHQHIIRSWSDVPLPERVRSGAIESVPARVHENYISRTAQAVLQIQPVTAPSLRVCYTPMHGVGGDTFLTVLERIGLLSPVLVTEQYQPNPDFPTVAFPNPEEPGALDLAIRTATENLCDLIIAHDPDADRLAVAAPVPGTSDWKALTGNQVGALLGALMAQHSEAAGLSGSLSCSLVSSPILESIAASHGLSSSVTPTGFKWISRIPGLVFGFEEALGYLVTPEVVRDKDGISAAALFLLYAESLKKNAHTVWDALDALSARYGAFASGQVSLRIASPSVTASLMAALRKDPTLLSPTRALGNVVDYQTGMPHFPPADILQINTASGERIIVRPSGTEPKVKIYIDALATTTSDAEHAVEALSEDIRESVNTLLARLGG